MSVARLVLAAAFALATAAGCKSTKLEDVPESELAIGEVPRLVVGPVGVGTKQREATYVLVDVANRGSRDAVVTLGGHLLDVDGGDLGPARAEALRLAAGETRLFALVDEKAERQSGQIAGARVELLSATRPGKPAGVVVTDINQHPDQGRIVVAGYAENQAGTSVTVVVLAAFYDEAGSPMMRQATIFELADGGRRSAQFVGPHGSHRGDIYIGDIGPRR